MGLQCGDGCRLEYKWSENFFVLGIRDDIESSLFFIFPIIS